MALKGIKVIEFAGLAPVPFCGMVLADFGASILRIDKVGANTELDCLGNGKRSIAINLKTSAGIKIAKQLCKTSDVLIEPFRPGVMEKLDLGPQVLLKENPKLIYARLTGYGQFGPYSKSAGHDINYLGLSGLLSLFGRAGHKPTFPVNFAADFAGGGLTCALGIILALYERSNSGLGQIIDCSMVEGTAYLGSWLYRSQTLPVWGQQQGNNFLDTGSHFYDVYETKDGKFMTVGALEPQFYNNLLKGLQVREEQAPHFDHFKESKALFDQKFKEKTQEEWCKIFNDMDACVAPVMPLEEAPKHPHNVVRKSFVSQGDGVVPQPAPLLNRTPGISSGVKPAPHIGQHSREILKTLGYQDSEISELVDDGVIECFIESKL